ncbi:hypothetical protein OQA88_7976 [Cercophora sp. LCS_1]
MMGDRQGEGNRPVSPDRVDDDNVNDFSHVNPGDVVVALADSQQGLIQDTQAEGINSTTFDEDPYEGIFSFRRPSAALQFIPSVTESSPATAKVLVERLSSSLRHDNEPEDEEDEDEDALSDVTDHTDLSLIEVFEPSGTPNSSMLLSLLVTLKEGVIDRIKSELAPTRLRLDGTRQHAGQQHSGTSFSSPPGFLPGSASDTSAFSGRQKRRLGDGEDPFDEDDGDEERRKRASRPRLADLLQRRFACPFFKRYPDNTGLHKSCLGPGWSSVHRVK